MIVRENDGLCEIDIVIGPITREPRGPDSPQESESKEAPPIDLATVVLDLKSGTAKVVDRPCNVDKDCEAYSTSFLQTLQQARAEGSNSEKFNQFLQRIMDDEGTIRASAIVWHCSLEKQCKPEWFNGGIEPVRVLEQADLIAPEQEAPPSSPASPPRDS